MAERELVNFSDQFYGMVLSIEEVARECAVHPEWIRRMVALGLLDPVDEPRELFQTEVIARIDRIRRLRRDLGVNYNGIALILELQERITELEGRLGIEQAGTQDVLIAKLIEDHGHGV